MYPFLKRKRSQGFTLPEVIVTAALCASFFTAAALVYQSVTANQRHLQSYQEVTLGEEVVKGLYQMEELDTINTYCVPNYGRAATADLMRDRFWDDIEKSTAIYCLGRNAINPVRVTEIPIDPAQKGSHLDSPNAFLAVLNAGVDGSDEVYQEYRGVCKETHGTIFLLGRSKNEDNLAVRAIYEIDLIDVASPVGVYFTVRRFVGQLLTDYYDFFHPDIDSSEFGPLFASFEKEDRLNLIEEDFDAYKQAKQRPFYFVWWPDPALPIQGDLISYSGGGEMDPRPAYERMGIHTSYLFTVPMFPPY